MVPVDDKALRTRSVLPRGIKRWFLHTCSESLSEPDIASGVICGLRPMRSGVLRRRLDDLQGPAFGSKQQKGEHIK